MQRKKDTQRQSEGAIGKGGQTTLYCVVYRTGGKINYKWHRSETNTLEESHKTLKRVGRMGYAAFIEEYTDSLNRGLPINHHYFPTHHWYDD